ncbi:SOS response-associated peptidase [Desulfosarcina sp.]|uniref:SOS response-associated peptidase n=1 Tax=Desulfosarcina sp. TaxID=2027861 RepID=UPI0039710290
MCGRFVGFSNRETLIKHFPIDAVNVEVTPSYNIAPTQDILAITRHDEKNRLEKLHWGLVPFWAKDISIGSRMINARSETLTAKPSFRTALLWRRCLIPADGFYEWKGAKGQKQPMFLALPDGRPFAFAGLWETWDNRGKASTPYRSCTILTRQAGTTIMPIHHRMPVILRPEAYALWLSRDNQDVQLLLKIIRSQVYTELKIIPVSKQVNAVRNNRPDNIKPISPA